MKDEKLLKRNKSLRFEDLEDPDSENARDEWPETKGWMGMWYLSWPLHLLFTWVFGVLWKGLRKPLRFKDLPKLGDYLKCEKYVPRFEFWFKRLRCLKKFRLQSTMYACFFFEICLSGFLKLVSAILAIGIPILMTQFLKHFQPLLTDAVLADLEFMSTVLPENLRPSTDYFALGYRSNDYEIWIWLVLYLVCQATSNILGSYSYYCQGKMCKKMKTTLENVIYRKIFTLSNAGKKVHSIAMFNNYLGYDCYLLDIGHQQVHEIWTNFIIICFSFSFITYILGIYALFSLLFFLFGILVLIGLLIILIVIRSIHSKTVDQRILLQKESFKNILVVKFFNLQGLFFKKILEIRKKEMKILLVLNFFRSMISAISYATPTIMFFISFIFYYYLYGAIDFIVLLTVLSYFKMLTIPLASISVVSIIFANSFASFGRIEKLLLQDEDKYKKEEEEKHSGDVELIDDKTAIALNGEFFWDDGRNLTLSDRDFVLKISDLEIEKGQLVMIVGNSRSGKTTFLESILKETDATKGSNVLTHGSISYCAQEPFLEKATVLENILMGKKLDDDKLKQVLSVCCLVEDLKNFEAGLNQEVGEGGNTLSGGQKSRIGLARGCFQSTSDIYLLDNVLSALDLFVTNHIFQYCVLGTLRYKTRLMVTNKLELLPYANRILFMGKRSNGTLGITEDGSYETLVKKKGQFYDFVKLDICEKSQPVVSYETFLEGEKESYQIEDLLKEKKKVVADEERNTGMISWRTFLSYFCHVANCCSNRKLSCFCGFLILFIIFLMYFGAAAVYLAKELHLGNVPERKMYHTIYGNMYNASFSQNVTIMGNETILSDFQYWNDSLLCPTGSVCSYSSIEIYWDGNYENETLITEGISIEFSIYIFLILGIGLLIVLVAVPCVFYIANLNATYSLFKKSVRNLLFTRMGFFFRNPLGRILNRLSLDVQRGEYDFLFRVDFLLILIFFVLASLALVIIGNLIFTPVAVVLIIVLLAIFLFFRKSIIELKRLESITRSNIFVHWNKTLRGLSTIKSMSLTDRFIKMNEKYINMHNTADFLQYACRNSIRTHLNNAGLICLVISISFAIVFTYYTDWLSYPLLAVGITNITSLQDIIGSLWYNCIVVEVEGNSIERLDHYGRNVKPIEGSLEEDTESLKIEEGRIQFVDYSMRYQPDFPLVLKEINLDISKGDKISVIGKTGSGKTSLINALTRICESSSGKILIDGIDIKSVSFCSLRDSISVIPQDPVVFQGTLRFNMDPFTKFGDVEIIDCLKKCHLEDFISRVGGLHGVIDEDGLNCSVGEKRLFCLARTMMRKSKIVLVDECTSIDYKLDTLIQEIVTKLDATVLSITHRLSNLVHYDKLIIVKSGVVSEFDELGVILAKKESHLFKLLSLLPNKSTLMKTLRKKFKSEVLEVESVEVIENFDSNKEQEVIKVPINEVKEDQVI